MKEKPIHDHEVVIIGGGPAGLTAAYELIKLGHRPIVFEKGETVGGIARTECYKNFYFDMGGHRFFTKSSDVKKVWSEILQDEFLRRPRLSRIYYKKRFFYYPLRPLNALFGLGLIESCLIILSYLWWHFFPYREEDTFEQWVTNRFGRRLFLTFFKSYTEKVWGIPCSELKAEWAAQRIKGLSLKTAVLNMFLKPKKSIKTLIEEFSYPRLGPGMMWAKVREHLESRGGAVRVETEVTKICLKENRIESVVVANNGRVETIRGKSFISSMPLTEFVKKIEPPPPHAVLNASERMTYRDFLTVCLIVRKAELFPDNWIYIHDPDVKVGRIQNFKNWSPDMVPDPSKSSLGLEYFCNEGDSLWTMADADLIELGKREVDRIGLANYDDVEDGCVFRVPKSYPIYDSAYREQLDLIKNYIEGIENFQTIGRNGLHRYNNQDHAMLTGMLAARNTALAQKNDVWSVNTDDEYHEEMEIPSDQAVDVLENVMAHVFRKLDGVAFGVSLGAALSLILFLATQILVLKGGDLVGKNLQLISHYFPGYRATMAGSFVGLGYGFVTGLVAGWLFAFLRNSAMFLYLAFARRSAERELLRKLLEYF